jgi:NOL1/NOP2/fmu family ribosome biogenesis protein
MTGNEGHRFDRLPATEADREVSDRPTRGEVLAYWDERFGVDPGVFEDDSFWERGSGKIWVLCGEEPTPVDVEALGMTFLRTRQEYWKPTMAAVQRFGDHATENVLELDRERARTFLAGDEQKIDWDGDWGYLVVAHAVAGETEPLGVGLFTYGTLRSQVPKGRRREL